MRVPRAITRPGDCRGFTLVELTLVAAILSILAALALPNIKMALVKARAVDVVADLDVMRMAVYNYLAENNDWPPDAAVGVVPSGLDVYLPDGFDFTKEHYTLNYDNWTTHSPYFIAVTAETSDDPVLGAAVVQPTLIRYTMAYTDG